ncbi:MAG: rod shape-determining protein MreC [Porphyromonas sp.]|nr:rod shape-determining protein MreC [Porphyromonas sp.]
MSKLLFILSRYKHWFVFFLLEALSLTVLFNESLYHRSVALVATNRVLGGINAAFSSVGAFFRLKEQNTALLEQIAHLEARYYRLEKDMQRAVADTVSPRVLVLDSVHPASIPPFVTARVIHMSSIRSDNYLSIDKGRRDGLDVDMTVMSESGVVGTIAAVSDHCAMVIPLINSKLKLSCRVKGKDFVGSLSWDNPLDMTSANLSDLPKHASVQEGDTIVTSGYSFSYMPNLIVGHVTSGEQVHSTPHADKEKDVDISSHTSFSSVPVRLATDFSRLSFVYVFTELPSAELRQLQEQIPANGR